MPEKDNQPILPVGNQFLRNGTDYYVLIGDKEKGPYDFSELNFRWSNGDFQPDALYAHSGMSQWEPLSNILGRHSAKDSPAIESRDTTSEGKSSAPKTLLHESPILPPHSCLISSQKIDELLTYYVRLDGHERGPFTLHQIRCMWNSGQLTVNTHYKSDDMEHWNPLSKILHEVEAVPAAFAPGQNEVIKTSEPLAGFIPKKVSAQRSDRGNLLGIVLVCLLLIPVLSRQIPAFIESLPQDLEREAYRNAIILLEDYVLGPKKFSSRTDSRIKHEGEVYEATISVDGLNGFGGPARNDYTVKMRYQGNSWKLIEITKD